MKEINERLSNLLNEEVNTEKLLELIASLEKDGEKVVVYNASNKQRISPQKLADLKIKKYTQDLTSEPVQIFVELDNEEKKSDKKEKCNKNEDYMANHIMTYIKKGYNVADKTDRAALRAIKDVCEIIAVPKKGLSYKDAEEIANEISSMINKDLHGDK